VTGYAAAREGAASCRLPDRAVLAVRGPLREKFLHNLLSNDVQGRASGQGSLAAFMDAHGHLQALLRVLVGGDTVWLEAPSARLAALEQMLAHYRVAAPVRFQPLPTVVLALIGPRGREVLARAGTEIPELGPEAHVPAVLAGVDVRVSSASDLPGPALALHVPDEAAGRLAAALAEAGAQALSPDVLDVLRIEQGRPRYGVDVTEENLLHETGLVREYHSPAKGCYVGQEVIARLEARGGNVNKRLRGLRLMEPAAAGAPITADGREVGRVTTAGVSPRLGPIAMGYVHRSRFEPGTAVEVAGAPATVAAFPLDPP
jgi:folate-binding protein YgfZ